MNENIVTIKYLIAGVKFSITMDPSLEHQYMKDFHYEGDAVDAFTVTVMEESHQDDAPDCRGKCIFESKTLDVFESSDGYWLDYKDTRAHLISKYDVSEHTVTIGYLGNSCETGTCVNVPLVDDIFYAIRDLFFLYCQSVGMIPIHSSSIIYNGRAYLFSAPSGTGKTTHTDMWQELYGVNILDGDVAMLSVNEAGVTAHGMPWCGSSNVYLNAAYPLGKIIFLKQSDANHVEDCNYFDSVIRVYARSFAPNWNRELAAKTVEVAKQIVNHGTCAIFRCSASPDAVQVVKQYIDDTIR